jgi:hypothetical protein
MEGIYKRAGNDTNFLKVCTPVGVFESCIFFRQNRGLFLLYKENFL